MADVHDKKTRSYNMSRIRAKDTKPELVVRRHLHSLGLRYRLHNKDLPGRPDIILKKFKVVIFVHGCYWHGHEGCKYFVPPKTRHEWWMAKISYNRRRDIVVKEQIRKMGWRPLIIWECELKKEKKDESLSILVENILRT